jgi:hypothetical protein
MEYKAKWSNLPSVDTAGDTAWELYDSEAEKKHTLVLKA